MHPIQQLFQSIVSVTKDLYGQDLTEAELPLAPTRKEFEGDYTLVTFPLTRIARKSPDQIAEEIGNSLMSGYPDLVADVNVIKGFLNIGLSTRVWVSFLESLSRDGLPVFPRLDEKILVEYSSPNTNKPLHLGHIRNILLGWSMSRIFERTGYEAIRVQVINDRGIAICKSMLAWELYGDGATPESSGVKGDHLVGEYYVRFESEFKKEYAEWQSTADAEQRWKRYQAEAEKEKAISREDFFKGYKNAYFNEISPLGAKAREMLVKWEQGDAEVRGTWSMMNDWVYKGFHATYDALGVSFHKSYYESNTYLLGRDLVEDGLSRGVFYRQDDGSVWIDLTDEGLDRKILLRSDGTSVYMTQDLGTAKDRYEDYHANRMIYVVADEQNYHFQVLFAIMKKLGMPFADGMVHLSYGMVELPTGKMKSREGTVVDADDLIREVISEARSSAEERGDGDDIPAEEQERIYQQVGLAALKYHIIKVNPKKRMIFDPKESVDLQGHTGPYIQNAYVRIQSIFRKAGRPATEADLTGYDLAEGEKELLLLLSEYRQHILQAAEQYDPSHVANYAYAVAKAFHKFYHDFSVLRAESELAREVRLHLAAVTASILKDAMELIGIEMPDRM
ncbi:MAG: arginine--tRNA ligase [Lewinellaceae bacterium]|nr:arginine--tRNA ligase [Saprospiraceae bacterium]MCB9311368.1 arginine--tRNA ligase [Lewinellaceae bacterium]HRW75016.1 arginine--tRNA ligase [Saprospiraceae bacterium]